MKKNTNNTLIIILIAILAIFLIGGISGSGMMGFGGCPMFGLSYTSTSFGIGSIFGSIISILIIISIVLFIIWIVKQLQTKDKK